MSSTGAAPAAPSISKPPPAFLSAFLLPPGGKCMSEIRTLSPHAPHYLGGRVSLMLLGFISFPVFTRVFSVAEYGAMSLVLKVVLLLPVVGKFGLQNSVQRSYVEEGA